MATKHKGRPILQAVPTLAHETVYVGVDIGKHKHVAGFVSKTLLERHSRFEACPAFTFEQSREGFRALIERIESLVPLTQVSLIFEHTGHYHRALEQYLLELDTTVYRIHVQKRPAGLMKTDKRDALGLANTLYAQLELGVQVADKTQLVRRAVPASETAAQLRGLTRHRREKFPTPQVIATASMSALREVRSGRHPSDVKLLELQRLASQSIGTKDQARLRGLTFEQNQLLKELRLIQQHIQQLDTEIESIIERSREGQILMSMGIGPISAATIIATIGSIANFEKPSELRSYFGWAPVEDQTGISRNRTSLTPRGSRVMKRTMYLITRQVLRHHESEWAKLYERLVPRMCAYDERTQAYVGRGKGLGRIAGQLVGMIYALLRKDYETLSPLAPGAKPPDPMLYDPEIHRRHRAGEYRSLKPGTRPRSLIYQVPKP